MILTHIYMKETLFLLILVNPSARKFHTIALSYLINFASSAHHPPRHHWLAENTGPESRVPALAQGLASLIVPSASHLFL